MVELALQNELFQPKKICCTLQNRSDTHDFNADVQDQKFAVLTPVVRRAAGFLLVDCPQIKLIMLCGSASESISVPDRR